MDDLNKAFMTLSQLSSAHATARQRSLIQASSLQQIQQFRSQLRYWQASYASYFDNATLSRFKTALAAYEGHFKSARQDSQQPVPAGEKGQRRPRVFETTGNQLLIGEPDLQQSNIYRITGANGRTEIYRQDASGKFALTNPAPHDPAGIRQSTLRELQAEANRHLEHLSAFTGSIERYASQGMDGASLYDLMQFKAGDLEGIATQIAAGAPLDPLVARLRASSADLLERGRKLRLERILQTREPNAGQLEYLIEQNLVSIERVGELIELNRTPEGRRDFLQEFVIRYTHRQPTSALWYAHVHFNKAAPVFADMVKAHLKTPAQRYLGREWQASHVEQIWRGELTRTQAMKHLAAHF